MNEYTGITFLRNKYCIQRHGESEANVAGLITSDPAQCISNYGLTEYGKERVVANTKKAMLQGWINAETIIYCSDFKRTMETAELARQILKARKFHPSPALRERSFGKLNGTHTDVYIEIWPKDQQDKEKQLRSEVEGAAEMLGRLIGFIKYLEDQHQNKSMLLVSHGDPLQVLQAAFAGLSETQSRSLKYIEPAEIRELTLRP